MKLLSWLNDPSDPQFLETPEQGTPAPALRERLEELKRMPVTKLMIPRPLIAALDADVQLRRVKRLKSSKVRYFPVYRGDLDHVLGWVEKSKILEILNEGREEARLEFHVQPLAKIKESAPVADLADVFLKGKTPMVLVVGPQGQTVGLVTLRDFIEQLFGFDMETTLSNAEPSAKSYEL